MSKITVGMLSLTIQKCGTLLTNVVRIAGVRGNVKELLEYSTEVKKRNFIETIELQIGLKNYDPQRDKRFSGTVKYVDTFDRTTSTKFLISVFLSKGFQMSLALACRSVFSPMLPTSTVPNRLSSSICLW